MAQKAVEDKRIRELVNRLLALGLTYYLSNPNPENTREI